MAKSGTLCLWRITAEEYIYFWAPASEYEYYEVLPYRLCLTPLHELTDLDSPFRKHVFRALQQQEQFLSPDTSFRKSKSDVT